MGSSFLSGFSLGGETGLSSYNKTEEQSGQETPGSWLSQSFSREQSTAHGTVPSRTVPGQPSSFPPTSMLFLLAKFVIPRHHRWHLHLCLLSLPVEVTMLKVAAWGELGLWGSRKASEFASRPPVPGLACIVPSPMAQLASGCRSQGLASLHAFKICLLMTNHFHKPSTKLALEEAFSTWIDVPPTPKLHFPSGLLSVFEEHRLEKSVDVCPSISSILACRLILLPSGLPK